MSYSFSQFSDKARNVIFIADEEAKALYHDAIGTEHILLALMKNPGTIIIKTLEKFEVTPEEIYQKVLKSVPPGPIIPLPKNISFTLRGKNAIENAIFYAATKEGTIYYVGTEHLLLGLLKDHTSIASSILGDICGTTDKVEQTALEFCLGKYNQVLLNTIGFSDQESLMKVSAALLKYYEKNWDAHSTVEEIKSIVK